MSGDIQKRHPKNHTKKSQFGGEFVSILDLKLVEIWSKIDLKSSKKNSIDLGIDFLTILADFGSQNGTPGRANEGPTNLKFVTEP